MDSFQKIKKRVSNWYLRYLVATELYILEPWEKAVIHVLFAVLFILFCFLNKSIVLTAVAQFRQSMSSVQEIS